MYCHGLYKGVSVRKFPALALRKIAAFSQPRHAVRIAESVLMLQAVAVGRVRVG